MSILAYNSETHVCVPKEELQKLEKERGNLYKYLESSGFFGEEGTREQYSKLSCVTSLTRQLWKVANTKVWGY
jgi:hypothetical protein